MFADEFADRFWTWARREVRWRWLGLVLLLLTAWFAWHALHGDRGLYAWLDKRRQVALLTQQLAELSGERATLAQRQKLLSGKTIDADLVEEQLLELGWLRDGDWFIPDSPADEKQR